MVKELHPRAVDKYYKRFNGRFMSSLKRFNTTQDNLAYKIIHQLNFNNKCPYCKTDLTTDNISFDHIIPISREGLMDIDNLEIVCSRCNRRKGMLTKNEFNSLLNIVNKFEDKGKKYVLRKLSMQDKH